MALLGVSLLWFAYLMAALFFYYADAFNADRRNNAMLFWKSMPVSDFTQLGSKMLAGLTLFPLLILAMIGITGLVLYGFSAVAVITVPGFELPSIVTVLSSAAQIGFFAVVFIALALLWYAPFLRLGRGAVDAGWPLEHFRWPSSCRASWSWARICSSAVWPD